MTDDRRHDEPEREHAGDPRYLTNGLLSVTRGQLKRDLLSPRPVTESGEDKNARWMGSSFFRALFAPRQTYGFAYMVLEAVVLVAVCVMLPLVLVRMTDPRVSLQIGIGCIVSLGASGLLLRGLGEIVTNAVRGRILKARGYLFGGAAYLATATVALSSAMGLLG